MPFRTGIAYDYGACSAAQILKIKKFPEKRDPALIAAAISLFAFAPLSNAGRYRMMGFLFEKAHMKSMHKTVALVTGANKGIGLEIARQLGQHQVSVIIGARDRARGEAAADDLRAQGLDAFFIEIDVTDRASVLRAAAEIGATHGQLDILVNNAGISHASDGRADSADIAAVKTIFDTNFFGVLAVTQAMLALLRGAPAGRIVNMSSSLGSMRVNADPSSPYYGVRPIGYNASKAALNMLTVALAEDLRDTRIVVNAACPGYARTDLNGNNGYLTPQQAAQVPVRLALLADGQTTGKFIDAHGDVPW